MENFKRGTIVRKTDTYWHGDLNESQKDIGKEYVIEYSYGERYGNGINDGSYCIISMENGGSSSWWHNDQLEYVGFGGEELIVELKKKSNEIEKLHKDLSWIKQNYSIISFDSVLQLFKEVGYKTSFLSNGEYCVLAMDWNDMAPIFNNLFEQKREEMHKEIEATFKAEYRKQYLASFDALYDKIEALR